MRLVAELAEAERLRDAAFGETWERVVGRVVANGHVPDGPLTKADLSRMLSARAPVSSPTVDPDPRRPYVAKFRPNYELRLHGD